MTSVVGIHEFELQVGAKAKPSIELTIREGGMKQRHFQGLEMGGDFNCCYPMGLEVKCNGGILLVGAKCSGIGNSSEVEHEPVEVG